MAPKVENALHPVMEEETVVEEEAKAPGTIVAESWEKVKAIPKYQNVAGELLFRRIFEQSPDATALFRFADGYSSTAGGGGESREDMYKNDPFVKHSTAVISTVTAAVGLLEAGETDTLVSVLQDLGARHAALRVRLEKAHYELVGEALLFTLSKALGAEAFTPTVKGAWLEVYEIITQQMMQGAAKEIMEKSPAADSKTTIEGDDEAKRLTAEIVTKSFLLTELAANQDPDIAKQNRAIAEQRNRWEAKAKALLLTNTMTTDDQREANRRAEELVNLSFQTTMENALQDPTVAEENRKIAEQKQQLLAQTTTVDDE